LGKGGYRPLEVGRIAEKRRNQAGQRGSPSPRRECRDGDRVSESQYQLLRRRWPHRRVDESTRGRQAPAPRTGSKLPPCGPASAAGNPADDMRRDRTHLHGSALSRPSAQPRADRSKAARRIGPVSTRRWTAAVDDQSADSTCGCRPSCRRRRAKPKNRRTSQAARNRNPAPPLSPAKSGESAVMGVGDSPGRGGDQRLGKRQPEPAQISPAATPATPAPRASERHDARVTQASVRVRWGSTGARD